DPVTTFALDEHADTDLYTGQRLEAPGFGYLTTRDGTTLSVNVWLPGPVDEGPYPTVVEYSGYTPSDPDSGGFGDIFTALGYAYVGVNMRGTGCSGGSFRYFEYTQNLDGYDAIETIAAQPWVEHGQVGMVGVSYPGISQLFVAQTQPPSLAAITPLSVLDDSFRANLYPGGILNTGFAVEWTQDRVEEARPEGQQWAADRIADGDAECEANQRLRLQNPDLLAEILETPFWVSPLGEELAPRTFVDRIDVPVFLAGAWQDEQTGGRFPTMLDDFTSSPALYASLVNGLHTEAISPPILPRYVEFLELYVARRTPELDVLPLIGPVLGEGIFGTADFEIRGERFDDLSYEEALAAFESEPPIEVLLEQGAAEGFTPGSPMPRAVEAFDAWPIPSATATAWYLGDDGGEPGEAGRLTTEPTGDVAGAVDGETSYLALPDGLPTTFYEGSSSAIWRTDVTYDWREPAPGTAAVFVSDPLDDDTVAIGSGSVDLWITSNLGDTDLEVTLSEIRPDGTEVYVQSGWLRASRRALDEDASSQLRPVHTHLEADAAPLPDGDPAPVRVELFPFAHPFRAGSQLRLTVDAPGGNRPVWAFDTIAGGEEVTIVHDADHPSRLVLAVVPGIEVPPGPPPCGSLRGQPCRSTG
ncbi:MAG: CocE/NonD family hydrolase, partial [Ilumatobacteraceae bacterium]